MDLPRKFRNLPFGTQSHPAQFSIISLSPYNSFKPGDSSSSFKIEAAGMGIHLPLLQQLFVLSSLNTETEKKWAKKEKGKYKKS